jgi:hypothetical protein
MIGRWSVYHPRKPYAIGLGAACRVLNRKHLLSTVRAATPAMPPVRGTSQVSPVAPTTTAGPPVGITDLGHGRGQRHQHVTGVGMAAEHDHRGDDEAADVGDEDESPLGQLRVRHHESPCRAAGPSRQLSRSGSGQGSQGEPQLAQGVDVLVGAPRPVARVVRQPMIIRVWKSAILRRVRGTA